MAAMHKVVAREYMVNILGQVQPPPSCCHSRWLRIGIYIEERIHFSLDIPRPLHAQAQPQLRGPPVDRTTPSDADLSLLPPPRSWLQFAYRARRNPCLAPRCSEPPPEHRLAF